MRRALVVIAALVSGCLRHDWEPVLDAGRAVTCSHENCRGCCEQGSCVSGYSDEACGLLGRKCEACPMDKICGVARSCVAPKPDGGPEWTGVYGGGSGPLQDPPAEQPARCASRTCGP